MSTGFPSPAGSTGFSADSGCRAAYQVVVAHDNYAAYVRAMRTVVSAFLGRVETENLRLHPWRFDDLAHEIWRKHASHDAAKTALFVVSASEAGELPEGVATWLTECFALPREVPGIVVALCESLNDFEVPWRGKLRAAATAAGFDFLEMTAPRLRQAG